MFDAGWYNVTCEACGTLFCAVGLLGISPWHPTHAAIPGAIAVEIPVPWEPCL
jgi:hypothetical protein